MRAVKGTYIGGQNLLCLNDVTKATEPQLYFWFQFWISLAERTTLVFWVDHRAKKKRKNH